MPEILQRDAHYTRSTSDPAVLQLRIVFATNIIPPYHKPLFDLLSRRFQAFRILLSTPMERNRSWKLDWQGLDVVIQKTFTFHGLWKHRLGFREPLFLHFPVDTVAQLRQFRPDVVVSWEMGWRTMLAAVHRLTHRRSKLMVWAEFAESTEYHRGRMRQVIRRLLHHAVDGFLVTGESGCRYLRTLGVPERKLFQIAYTTDVERFAEAATERCPSAARRLLYVGQLIERKGLKPFLAALSEWAVRHPAQPVEMELAGEGPLRAELEALVMAPNLKLSFSGNIPYEDLPAVYARAGIFVLPTLADTWGVVVNEAMAAGLPVLGSVFGQAVSELVEDGTNGWTFRPDRPAEMSEAIGRCLETHVKELDEKRQCARDTAMRLSPEYVSRLITDAITSCTATG